MLRRSKLSKPPIPSFRSHFVRHSRTSDDRRGLSPFGQRLRPVIRRATLLSMTTARPQTDFPAALVVGKLIAAELVSVVV